MQTNNRITNGNLLVQTIITCILTAYAATITGFAIIGLKDSKPLLELPMTEALRDGLASISIIAFGCATFIGAFYGLYLLVALLGGRYHVDDEQGNTHLFKITSWWMTCTESMSLVDATLVFVGHLGALLLGAYGFLHTLLMTEQQPLSGWMFFLSIGIFFSSFMWLLCRFLKAHMRDKS